MMATLDLYVHNVYESRHDCFTIISRMCLVRHTLFTVRRRIAMRVQKIKCKLARVDYFLVVVGVLPTNISL